jgi:transcriptional regulator with XRE-family HTH domain
MCQLPKKESMPVNILEKKRAEAGLSIQQLADLIKVHRNTIYNLEKGLTNAKPVTIAMLAKALNCSYEDLLPLQKQAEDKRHTQAIAA